MSASAFIAQIAPITVQLRVEGSPIFPSVRIAQSGLETGWKIPPWNNLGGYKVGSGKLTPYWRGAIVNKGTWEVYDGKRVDVTAAFRAYDTVEDFFRDQDLLFGASRYDRVRTARTPEEQCASLQLCGYATDPAYAGKLMAIIREYGLKKYDEEAIKVLETIRQLQQEVAALRKEVSIQSAQVGALLAAHDIDEAPQWAKEAVDAAVAAGIVDTPQGSSLDFYRFVTILHRAGLIPNTRK